MSTVTKEAVEKFLDANLDFTKEYYDRKLRPEVIGKLLSNRKTNVDFDTFHTLTSVEESEIVFDLIRDFQDNVQMERCCFNILKRVGFIIQADRMSLFMYRMRNGTGELATRLFNIHKDATLEECLVMPDSEIVFPLDTGVLGYVAQSKKVVNVTDVDQVGYMVKKVVCELPMWGTVYLRTMLCLESISMFPMLWNR
ncbi:hypothetical protein NDU88_005073 [Pleurodeles waltl]|uniref:Uncharacterized protein n=1 Tax=Pleurodeles waltl TaxID=8319 RepID=A0AAV7PEB4_PLEWA|nr:hypothetical protein NDU88_005073 [Pleurodeles waltl]